MVLLILLGSQTLTASAGSSTTKNLAASSEITGSWTFIAAVDQPNLTGEELSTAKGTTGMSPAVVPGTVLTSMLANGVYPDPFYGRIVTETIPDTLKDTDYWYRTEFTTPALLPHQRLFIQIDGVSYMSSIFMNGKLVGSLQGAFMRGYFDVTDLVDASGGASYLVIQVIKLDFSEGPLYPNYTSGVTRGGRNGGPTGITLKNGPSIFCSAGWDWLPSIPDRNLGPIAPVSWFTTGNVRITNLNVESYLSDDNNYAKLQLDVTLENLDSRPHTITLVGQIGSDGTKFKHTINIPVSNLPIVISLTPLEVPELGITNPKLWWPNGYGEPYLYAVTISTYVENQISDTATVNLGLRKIQYTRDIGYGKQLSITINDVPMLIMGGNWGLDEALKRIPRQRLFDQVRLHRDANLNLIRNWNGQSTGKDFYDACDFYGILVWQDFFYSTEGPPAANDTRDLDNVRDIIYNFRIHPCILLWCGGNEGSPPVPLIDGLLLIGLELDPRRLVITSSAGDTFVDGYTSGGPYNWVSPMGVFNRGYGRNIIAFRNELGSHSIPGLEFVQKMIPETSWECPDNYWADRDINGNGAYYPSLRVPARGGAGFIAVTAQRYGVISNLADFVRKSQMMNYEGIKAIYEATAAVMIGPISAEVPSPSTGAIMWMTNPAQPSFVWQMYTHDLEQFSSYFAVQRACRRVNIILNALSFEVTIANHASTPLYGTGVQVQIYTLDGSISSQAFWSVKSVAPESHQYIDNIDSMILSTASPIALVNLVLLDSSNHSIVENLYWVETNGSDRDYTSLDTMPPAILFIIASQTQLNYNTTMVNVTVSNFGTTVALMVHIQLFDIDTGLRVLPAFYNDNYLNLIPGATSQITIEVPDNDSTPSSSFGVRVDSWKLDQVNTVFGDDGVPVSFNTNALNIFMVKFKFVSFHRKFHEFSYRLNDFFESF
eukprot:gene15051-17810_t